MSKKSIATSVVLVLSSLSLAAGVSAQDVSEEERERIEQEEQRLMEEQRQRLIEQEAILEQRQAQFREASQYREQLLRQAQLQQEEQQDQMRRVQSEMQRARQDLERAAREVARLSQQNAPRVQQVQRAYRNLLSGPRALLGVTIENEDEGARVTGVTPGGAAAEAGIETGDVLVLVNGVEIEQEPVDGGRSPVEIVVDTMSEIEPGAIVPVQVLRGDDTMSFDVETREGDRNVFFWQGPQGRPPGTDFNVEVPGIRVFNRDGEFAWTGMFGTRWRDMELITISEGLGSYFGTDEGLLVVRAPSDEEVGLEDGDVILEISGRTPNSPQHAMRILGSFEPGETVEFSIMRRQRRDTLEYEIPGRDD